MLSAILLVLKKPRGSLRAGKEAQIIPIAIERMMLYICSYTLPKAGSKRGSCGSTNEGQNVMDVAQDKLNAILFHKDRQFRDIKFFPGDDPGLSVSVIHEEAARVIESVFSKGLVDNPPHSRREKTSI